MSVFLKFGSGLFVLLGCVGTAVGQHSSQGASQSAVADIKADLVESDRRINALYQQLMGARDQAGKTALRDEQRAWLKSRDASCRINSRETDREKWFDALLADGVKTVCVVRETRGRIAALEAMRDGRMAANVNSPPPARPPEAAMPGADGKPRATTLHSDGKWYFELIVDRAAVARIQPAVIAAGFTDSEGMMTSTMVNVRASDLGTVQLGFAVDLDQGMVYFRHNGSWNGKEPGSNKGVAIKLGQAFKAQLFASSDTDVLIAKRAIVPNFGDSEFTFPPPAGYKGWRWR